VIVGFNLEDVFPAAVSGFAALSAADRRLLKDDVISLYHTIAENFRKHAAPEVRLLVQNIIPPFSSYDALARTDRNIHDFVDDLNVELRTAMREYSSVHVLDYARLSHHCGLNDWVDPRTYYSARIPVAQKHWIALARYYAAHIRALLHAEI